jgi:hypothetical protein
VGDFPTASSRILTCIVSDLEKAVEALSEMLEEEVSAETVPALRQRMMDKTVSGNSFEIVFPL